MKKILFLTFMLLGMVTMSTVNAATNAITATQAATTYYNGTLTTKMASGKVRTTTNFQNSYITSDGTFGIDEFRIGSMPGTITGRVSGGNFTLPSLGTVLDSLPSHGSSYLTLLFIN